MPKAARPAARPAERHVKLTVEIRESLAKALRVHAINLSHPNERVTNGAVVTQALEQLLNVGR